MTGAMQQWQRSEDGKRWDRELFGQVWFQAGHCPICSSNDRVRVYRSSLRSVTLQHVECGLQWTMTWHMLARAARTIADRMAAEGSRFTPQQEAVAQEFEARAAAARVNG